MDFLSVMKEERKAIYDQLHHWYILDIFNCQKNALTARKTKTLKT